MKNIRFYRYLAYSLEILLLFVLGSTPKLLPQLFGAVPCLLVSLALAIAVFENELPAMFFGLVCLSLIHI